MKTVTLHRTVLPATQLRCYHNGPTLGESIWMVMRHSTYWSISKRNANKPGDMWSAWDIVTDRRTLRECRAWIEENFWSTWTGTWTGGAA